MTSEPETWNQLDSSLGHANAGAFVSCTIAHGHGVVAHNQLSAARNALIAQTFNSSPREDDPIVLGCYRIYASVGVYLQHTWLNAPAIGPCTRLPSEPRYST